MTAEVIRVFTHEHNLLAAAWQEYELACIEYESASSAFDSLSNASVERFHRARERRSAAYDNWWAVRRGA